MYPIFASSHPDFKLQVAQVPAGPGGSVSVVGGEDTVVFRNSKNKALAEEFTRYLLSGEAQLAFAKIGQMSVLKDLDVVVGQRHLRPVRPAAQDGQAAPAGTGLAEDRRPAAAATCRRRSRAT